MNALNTYLLKIWGWGFGGRAAPAPKPPFFPFLLR